MSDPRTIYARMVSITKDVGAIGKDRQSNQFAYRGIDDVYNSLNSLMAKHGVFTIPTVLEKTRQERASKNGGILAFTCLRIKYTFYGEAGDFVECVVEGEAMDSGDKSSNKAMSVAHKYALIQAFTIPTAEQKDPDQEIHEVAPLAINIDQQTVLSDLLTESGTDEAAFLAHYSKIAGFTISSLSQLPEPAYLPAKKALESKANKGKL